MFLSKKTATHINKPKNQDTNKAKKVLGGWEDEQEKVQTVVNTKVVANTKPSTNLLQTQMLSASNPKQVQSNNPTSNNKNILYYDWDTLNDRKNIEIQKGLVQQIINTSGIRIKPNQNTLNDFLKEVKWLDISIIGSLLLSKIQVNYPFAVKAKALYTIQFLSKKNQEYLKYFSHHVQKLKEFPQPEDNVENYKKILKTLLNVIGVSSPSQHTILHKVDFIDPGYNKQIPAENPKSAISSFINENSNKGKKIEVGKAMIGPGQSKQKVEVKKETNSINLLEFDINFQTSNNDNSLV